MDFGHSNVSESGCLAGMAGRPVLTVNIRGKERNAVCMCWDGSKGPVVIPLPEKHAASDKW